MDMDGSFNEEDRTTWEEVLETLHTLMHFADEDIAMTITEEIAEGDNAVIGSQRGTGRKLLVLVVPYKDSPDYLKLKADTLDDFIAEHETEAKRLKEQKQHIENLLKELNEDE